MRLGELDDDVDKLESGEHNVGNKGWAKVMRWESDLTLLSMPPV